MTRRARWIGGLLLLALVVALTAAVMLAERLIGVHTERAIVVAAVVGAVIVLVHLLPSRRQDDWPAAADGASGAGWHQAALLQRVMLDAAADPDAFAVKLRPRLRALAEARLRRQGTAWADPRARVALGHAAYELLDRGSPLVPGPAGMLPLARAASGRGPVEEVEAPR